MVDLWSVVDDQHSVDNNRTGEEMLSLLSLERQARRLHSRSLLHDNSILWYGSAGPVLWDMMWNVWILCAPSTITIVMSLLVLVLCGGG